MGCGAGTTLAYAQSGMTTAACCTPRRGGSTASGTRQQLSSCSNRRAAGGVAWASCMQRAIVVWSSSSLPHNCMLAHGHTTITPPAKHLLIIMMASLQQKAAGWPQLVCAAVLVAQRSSSLRFDQAQSLYTTSMCAQHAHIHVHICMHDVQMCHTACAGLPLVPAHVAKLEARGVTRRRHQVCRGGAAA